MLLLAGIALIVIGPKQLPQMARMLGRMLNEFRRATSEFTSSIDDFKTKTRSYMHETEDAMRKIPETVMKPTEKPKAEKASDETAHLKDPEEKDKS